MKTDIKRPRPIKPGGKLYKFSIEKRWLTMPDGVRLAASLYIPKAKRRGEVFPTLLEYLPYRKDDTFYPVDHQCFSYFAQLGFIAVKVDIRGTGASEGFIPEREYSDQEMVDCTSIIELLAADAASNGNVGMFGTSWSGFNSLQMAMRRPPALKAIHAVHASDDLFHDDVHLIDGNLHLDSYHLFINTSWVCPRRPNTSSMKTISPSVSTANPGCSTTSTISWTVLSGASNRCAKTTTRSTSPCTSSAECSMVIARPPSACSKV